MRIRSPKTAFNEKLSQQKLRLELDLAKAFDVQQRALIQSKIKELDAAMHMDGWLRSPGLRPPE